MSEMTLEDIEDLIRQAVEKATGWPAFIIPLQGPEPANQYCTINLSNQYKQPYDVVRYSETDTALNIRQRSESTLYFEIQARGRGAMEKLDELTSYLDSPERDIDLWPFVGSGGHEDSQCVSTYHQGKILEVGVLNIAIHANTPKLNTIEYMNSVDITTYSGNTEVVTITVPDAEPNQGE